MEQQGDLVLVGGGGHCRSCIDVIEAHGGWRIVAILDVAHRVSQQIMGYSIAGTDDDIARYSEKKTKFLVTVGQIKNAEARLRIFDKIQAAGGLLATIASPMSYVSAHARVGAGTIIMHRAVINCDAVVGENTIINTMALIEHGAKVGSHCHVSTAAVVNGEAQVGDRCFVGSNAVLHQGVHIANETIVPAGSVCRGPIL